MWDSNMTDEYFTAVTLFHLSWGEILQMGHDSLAHAFAPPDVRRRLLADFDRRIAAFTERYGSGTLDQALSALGTVHPVTYGYAKRNWGFSFN